MSEAMFMYGVTTGIFAFLAAVLFGTRGSRRRHGPEEHLESHSSGGSGEGGKAKKFKSDGTPA